MVRRFPLQQFFRQSQQAWSVLPDYRQPSPNTKYDVSDAVNSAMSVFFMQSQSFLAHHQELRKRRKGKKNLHTLFEVENVPTDNQIRTLLDPLEPAEFAPQYEWVWQQLARMGGLQPYQTSLGTRLIALDGMTYHSSSTIWMRPLLDTTGPQGDHPLLPCNGVTPDGAPGCEPCPGLLSRDDHPSGRE